MSVCLSACPLPTHVHAVFVWCLRSACSHLTYEELPDFLASRKMQITSPGWSEGTLPPVVEKAERQKTVTVQVGVTWESVRRSTLSKSVLTLSHLRSGRWRKTVERIGGGVLRDIWGTKMCHPKYTSGRFQVQKTPNLLETN